MSDAEMVPAIVLGAQTFTLDDKKTALAFAEERSGRDSDDRH